MAQTPRYAVDSDPNPFLFVDLNKCILCTRCIRACNDIQGRSVWSLAERGIQTHIVAGAGYRLDLTARCESCGACVAYCPTGALDNKMSMGAGKPDRLVTTTCTYCGVGCQFDLNVKNDRVIRVTSNPKGAGQWHASVCQRSLWIRFHPPHGPAAPPAACANIFWKARRARQIEANGWTSIGKQP